MQITTGLGADGADPVRAKSHANRVTAEAGAAFNAFQYTTSPTLSTRPIRSPRALSIAVRIRRASRKVALRLRARRATTHTCEATTVLRRSVMSTGARRRAARNTA